MSLTPRCTCSGFTMVELVLVILIAGVLAAVAVPRMVNQSAFQSRGAAAEIRTALRYAQRLAMAKNHEACVTTTANSMTLAYNPTTVAGAACVPVIAPNSGASYVVALPAGITLTPVAPFRFDGQGRPGGAVSLTVSGTPAITVASETGYVQ